MKNSRSTLAIAVIFLAGLFLVGCNLPNLHLGKISVGEVRIGMFGSNLPGHMDYSYKTFNGYEQGSLQAEAGQSIILDYQATVTKGELTFKIQDEQEDVLWSHTLQADEEERVEIPVKKAGRLDIFAQAQNAGGSFALDWQLK